MAAKLGDVCGTMRRKPDADFVAKDRRSIPHYRPTPYQLRITRECRVIRNRSPSPILLVDHNVSDRHVLRAVYAVVDLQHASLVRLAWNDTRRDPCERVDLTTLASQHAIIPISVTSLADLSKLILGGDEVQTDLRPLLGRE